MKRVLIIDDEEYLRKVLADAYARLNAEVVSCTGADEGIVLLRQGEKFDLILLDVRMPVGGDGFQFMKEYLSFEPNPGFVVMMTGFPGLSQSKVQKAGAQLLIRKPFAVEQLRMILDEQVKKVA
ncbi:MAG: response regulator [Bdellovibrionales bacterium]|nr:response regulator [Bdellovibrionales bacterium]